MTKPATLCMAPWTHTYLSPQTERRMCCASREPAQNFQQYIDVRAGTGRYLPITLEQHWNSDHMRSVRKRMLAGETLPECEVCNDKLLNTSVYRDYFTHLFGHLYQDILDNTDEDGTTSLRPVSWDYRFTNLCNFKCRHCGDMLSSAWETEERQHDMIDWNRPHNNWMLPEIRQQISQFQDTQIEQEFQQAVEEHRVQEVYWVGGEPLMYEQHWRYMKRIIELGDGNNVYARYNTNLHRIDYRGDNLFTDILDHVGDWQICASLDGTGKIGEYIRDGLDFQRWLENFTTGLQHQKHSRQMRIDFTLTTPGLLEIINIQRLGQDLGVELLTKVIFAFSPDIVMSPLALPRSTLTAVIEPIMSQLPKGAMFDMLEQLLKRPTFQEQWPESYDHAVKSGKQRMQKIERIRNDTFGLDDIFAQHQELDRWWHSID